MMGKRALWMLRIAIAIIAPLSFNGNTYAASPREQLKQMVEQLQKSPNDNALREKIIKFAQTIKPAPAVPDEAIEFEGRAQFAFKNAKSNDDFLAAAREYERAVAKAPWVSGYYSDLCTIYEKAGKFEEAKRNCEFSLGGLADPAQITDIKRRIAGLKYGMEQNSPEAIAAKKRAEREKRGVTGFWQMQSSRCLYYKAGLNEWMASWHDSGDVRLAHTFEFRKIGDSYEINYLTRPDMLYRTKRAGVTNIEFGTAGSCGTPGDGCEERRCELAGEGLFCTYEVMVNGTLFSRDEERFVRWESCATVGPLESPGRFPIRCR